MVGCLHSASQGQGFVSDLGFHVWSGPQLEPGFIRPSFCTRPTPISISPFSTARGTFQGINLPKSEAQAKSLELGKLGCDPVALTNSFRAAQGSKDQRLKDASDSAMRANLNGEARRYAKDGQIYSVKDGAEL